MADEPLTFRTTIGIVGARPGWQILLRQLGVQFEKARFEQMTPAHYGVVIVADELSDAELRAVETYLEGGGAVLDNGGFLSRVDRASLSRRHVGSIPGDRGDEIARTLWLLDVDRRVAVHREAGHLHGTIHCTGFGRGALAHLPFPIHETIVSHRAARRKFHSPLGHHPDEHVATASKGEYRRLVESLLKWLLFRRGLPYVLLWHLPDREESLFCYRIDTDYGTPAELVRLRDLADSFGMPATWFLHVGAHAGFLELFDGFGGHEIGVHGYRHRTFPGYTENWANISEAIGALRAAGLPHEAFAAPTGRWNSGLDRALREHGIRYSSEFTIDYDDLPFFPYAAWSWSPVLQVPVHPVSVGNFLRVKGSEEEMTAYFLGVLDRKLFEREPAILYHHPGQHALGVVESIFAGVRERGIRTVTMGEYAEWWRGRQECRLEAALTGGTLRIESRLSSSSHAVRVWTGFERAAFVTGTSEIRLSEIEDLPEVAAPPIPRDLPSIRRPDLTLLRHSLEDTISRIRQ